MNRLPAAAAALAAAVLVTVGSLVPAQELHPPVAAEASRVTVDVGCPGIGTVGHPALLVAAGDGAVLTTAKLTSPGVRNELTGVGALRSITQPMLVGGPRSAVFGATAGVSARSGPSGGLTMAACRTPRSDWWLPGVGISELDQAELVLLNQDSTEAAVDVTVIGAEGRIPAPGSRGIVVGPHSQRVVSLGPLAASPTAVTLRVQTSQGRVVAGVRQGRWPGNQPIASDWIPAASDPGTAVVVPGIPGGKGVRRLVVVNPGQRTARVGLEVLGLNGRVTLTGLEAMDVPAGTTRTLELARGLGGEPAALRLRSDQRITASVISDSGEGSRVDFAVQAAVAPIGELSIWPVPVPRAARVTLMLTNAGEGEALATVKLGNGIGADLATYQVPLPPGLTAVIDLPATELPVVRIEKSSGEIHAGVIATQSLGSMTGLASFGVSPNHTQLGLPEVRYDPRSGS